MVFWVHQEQRRGAGTGAVNSGGPTLEANSGGQLWRLGARGSCFGNKPKAGWSSKQSSEVQISQEKVGYGEGKLKISGHGAISTHHVH